MAGRGPISGSAWGAERGGLQVLLTEYHESRRIDRQFFGRCARQGDPGSCEAIVSLDDEIYTVYAPGATALIARAATQSAGLSALLHRALRRFAQYRAERRGAYARVQNLAQDRRLERVLAFSGRADGPGLAKYVGLGNAYALHDQVRASSARKCNKDCRARNWSATMLKKFGKLGRFAVIDQSQPAILLRLGMLFVCCLR